MKLSLMRKVDYWFGIPLCFLASLFTSVSRLFCTKDPRPISKILFIELSEMGSAILAHSSMVRAKEKNNAQLYFLIFHKNRESVDLLNLLPKENVITINDRNLFLFCCSTISALIKIRLLSIDTCIDLELFSRCTALLTFLSGAQRRVGFYRYLNEGLYRGDLLTHKVWYNPYLHIALNFVALVRVLEDEITSPPLVKQNLQEFLLEPPAHKTDSACIERIKGEIAAESSQPILDSQLVILNPDPGMLHLRGWSIENFAELSQRILNTYSKAIIVIIGLSRSREFANYIQQKVNSKRCVDFTGKTHSVAELVDLLSFSHLLITCDSGPAHMASLTKIKSIVLFGPETPSLYGPLGGRSECIFANLACSPCFSAYNHRDTVCTDNICMKAIKVDQVFEKVGHALQS